MLVGVQLSGCGRGVIVVVSRFRALHYQLWGRGRGKGREVDRGIVFIIRRFVGTATRDERQPRKVAYMSIGK